MRISAATSRAVTRYSRYHALRIRGVDSRVHSCRRSELRSTSHNDGRLPKNNAAGSQTP